MMLRQQFQTAVSLIYPSACVSCGAQVQDDFGLCGQCWSKTEFISGASCDSCGCSLPGHAPDGERNLCDGCLSDPPPWNRGRAALAYQGQGKRLVLALKHGDRTDLARPAAGWLQKAGQDLLRNDPLLVPVPLHWSRLLRRGYNQAALLAQALALRGNWDCCPNALLRSKMTPSLDHKSRKDRQTLLSDAIRVNPRQAARLTGRKIILIDDVMTSGATLRACTAACQAAEARDVHVLVLARVNGSVTGREWPSNT